MIPIIPQPPGFAGPDWITVLRVCTHLPDNAPVTREVFEASGNLDQFLWAIRERELEGQVEDDTPDSPFLKFVEGETASVVREALPVWAMFLCLAPISASEVVARYRDPAVYDRWRAEARVWEALVRDPLHLRQQVEPTLVITPHIPTSMHEVIKLIEQVEARSTAHVRRQRSGPQARVSDPRRKKRRRRS